MHVAVLPFAVTDQNDPALQALAQGLVPTFTNMISRLQVEDDSLWVVPASEIVRAGVNSSADARRLMGVDVVLTGMLHKRDSAVDIQLELVDPAGVRQVDSRRISGPLDPDFEVAATEALRELLNLEPTGRTVAERESLKPGARHLYIQGLGYLRRYDIPENLASAVTLFSAAIARDSLYAAAHAGLCEARWEQYRRTRMAHRAEQAFESCDRAASISDSEPTVLITLGRIFLERGDPRRAESSLRRASGLAPDNPDAWVWLGRVHEELGRLAGAEGAYRRAIRLKPSAWKYYWELGQYLAYFSRHAEALEQFESVRELAPDNPLAYLGIGYSLLRQDRVEDAEAMFQVAIERGASATAYHDLGVLYLRQNDFDAAIEALRKGLAQEERHLPIWRMLGHALYWTGQEEAAREAWSRMLDLAETNLEVNPRDAVSLMALAEGNVLMNRGEDGRRYLDRLLALEWQPTFHTYEVARLYEIMGERRKALLHLELALSRGFDRVAAERDPWLESLREDPGYGQLLQHIEQDADGDQRGDR
jgi:tetratricopeptide (TPR) repeat protein